MQLLLIARLSKLTSLSRGNNYGRIYLNPQVLVN